MTVLSNIAIIDTKKVFNIPSPHATNKNYKYKAEPKVRPPGAVSPTGETI